MRWPKPSLLIWSILLLPQSVVEAQEPKSGKEKSTAELVQLLGSHRFVEREGATRTLAQRRDAVPELRDALTTADAETRQRLKRILAELSRASAARILDYGRNGRVDVLVEWLAIAGAQADEDACWQTVMDIAFAIRSRCKLPAGEKEAPLSSLPSSFREYRKAHFDFENYRLGVDPRVRPEDVGKYAVTVSRGAGVVRTGSIGRSLLAVLGDVNLGLTADSIVFANGNVTAGSVCNIVVADGSVACPKWVRSSVLIARERISVGGHYWPIYCHIESGQQIRLDTYPVPDAAATPKNLEERAGTYVAEHQRFPLGIRFFELSDVGIEAGDSKEGVKVVKVADGALPGRAGLKGGDIILAVDGQKTLDADTLRRQLRRAFVQDAGTLTVRRGQQTIALNVAFYGYDLPKD